MKNYSLSAALVWFILLCYPALSLAVKSAMSAAFFMLLIISLVDLSRLKADAWLEAFDGTGSAFFLVMSLPALSIFFGQIYHGELDIKIYDGPIRYLLAAPIYFALRRINIRAIAALQYGFPLGAMASLVIVVFFHDVSLGQGHDFFPDAIHFGDIALLFGFLAVLSINWTKSERPCSFLFKLFGFCSGIYASVMSGSRGGWVAIPVFMFIWLMAQTKIVNRIHLLLLSLLIIFTSLAAYFFIGIIHSRVDEAYGQLLAFSQGNLDSSIGVRLQQWNAGFALFMKSPIYGIGSQGYAESFSSLYQMGLITEKVVYESAGELHSDILASLVRYGILGLMALMTIYFVPLIIFFKSARSNSNIQRVAAYMGIVLVSGFFIFGLTVEFLNLKMTISFYGLTLAALLAAATSRNMG